MSKGGGGQLSHTIQDSLVGGPCSWQLCGTLACSQSGKPLAGSTRAGPKGWALCTNRASNEPQHVPVHQGGQGRCPRLLRMRTQVPRDGLREGGRVPVCFRVVLLSEERASACLLKF